MHFCGWNGQNYFSSGSHHPIKNSLPSRASRISNLGTCFFVHLITCLCKWLCTLHFVHLKQPFVHTCTLTHTLLCTNYKDWNIDTFSQVCLKALNMCLLVRLLANILIRTSRLCRNGDFAQITHTLSKTHIMAEIFTISSD